MESESGCTLQTGLRWELLSLSDAELTVCSHRPFLLRSEWLLFTIGIASLKMGPAALLAAPSYKNGSVVQEDWGSSHLSVMKWKPAKSKAPKAFSIQH